jgi:hypothetical protein
MNKPYRAANIILHIAIISVFIIVLFYTYGLSLEEKVLEYQIGFVFNKIKRIIVAVNPNFNLQDNEMINNLQVEDDPATIKRIDDNNNKLKKKSAIALGCILGVAILLVLFIGKKYDIIDDDGVKLDMKTYLYRLGRMNLISLIFVGLTYIAFITFVGKNYLYINDNLIIKKTLYNLFP